MPQCIWANALVLLSREFQRALKLISFLYFYKEDIKCKSNSSIPFFQCNFSWEIFCRYYLDTFIMEQPAGSSCLWCRYEQVDFYSQKYHSRLQSCNKKSSDIPLKKSFMYVLALRQAESFLGRMIFNFIVDFFLGLRDIFKSELISSCLIH